MSTSAVNSSSDLLAKYGPWAVIAGASEGTGAEFARQLASAGLNLVLVSRRAERLEKLAAELKQHNPIQTRILALDLSTADAADKLFAATSGIEVGLYISNAGADLDFRPILDRPLENLTTLINFNVATVTSACYRFLQPMRARGRGGVVIMSSVSGLVGGQPGSGLYSATKAFELALAESLSGELRPHNVDVIGIGAPPMSTEAAVRALEAAGMATPEAVAALYKPADVVAQSLAMLGKKPSHIFNFVGVETETGEATTTARHARIKAVEQAIARMFGMDK